MLLLLLRGASAPPSAPAAISIDEFLLLLRRPGGGPAVQGVGPLFFYIDATPLTFARLDAAPSFARITAEPL